MEAFKERLLNEAKELNERIKKLTDFLSSDKYSELLEDDPIQVLMMELQLKSMVIYSKCLEERIKRLNIEG